MTGQGAPATATVTVERGRTAQPLSVVSRTAASGGLPTSRLARAAAGASRAPERGTPRWAWPGRPWSWTVVSAPARTTDEGAVGHRDPTGTKRTRVPGDSSAAGTRAWSHSTASVVPISCQPPGDERGYTPVYGPARATEPAGTVVRGVARRGDVVAGRQPGQIAEAGGEPAEGDPEFGRRVDPRHLLRGHAPVGGDIGQVGAVVAHRDLHDVLRARGMRAAAREAVSSGGQPGRVVEAVEEDRAGRGDDLAHGEGALRAAAQQLGVQGLGLLARGHLDEQGAVADRQRPHTKASTRTPDASRRARTWRARSTAPGVSPCRHRERARTSICAPGVGR